jgi:hypothetical protein
MDFTDAGGGDGMVHRVFEHEAHSPTDETRLGIQHQRAAFPYAPQRTRDEAVKGSNPVNTLSAEGRLLRKVFANSGPNRLLTLAKPLVTCSSRGYTCGKGCPPLREYLASV